MNVIPRVFRTETGYYSSVSTKAQDLYIGQVKRLFLFLHQRQLAFFAGVVATLLIEPHCSLRAAYLMQKGLGNKLTNLNPKNLSEEQLKCAPVLLIHGDSSNSGLFAPMIEQITKDFPHKPIFTIDLISPDGIVSAKSHLNPIVAKVREIEALYPSSILSKISFIGHSSGGDVLGPLARVMQAENQPLSGTFIKVGSIFKQIEAQEFSHGKVLEIVGTKDVFEGCESHLPNKLVVVSGHLGLIFNKIVLKRISNEIS